MVIRTGERRYPSTDYKTSKYCVAYLDVLGSKDIIYNDKENKHLNILNMVFEDAFSEVSITKKLANKDFFVKIFSDNIILATKTENKERKENITLLLLLISNIIEEFLAYGYLIRGAVVEGDFFYNDVFVYGKALIDVVELEEKHAKYPRVIVQKEIQEILPQYFYKDADNWNLLNSYLINDNGISIYNFKESLKTLLKSNKGNEKALQKVMWAINYFNEYNYWKKLNRIPSYCFISKEEISDALK